MKTAIYSLVIALILTVIIYGCSGEDKPGADNETMSGQENRVDSTLVRDRNADLSSIDVNKDNMVFQCMMDYNVISDEPGQCPLCKMKLRELNIAEARSNLNKFFEN